MTNTEVVIANFRIRTIDSLMAELVELGREAWRVTQRERLVRDQITALQELDGE
jgi:hypothetical protein